MRHGRRPTTMMNFRASILFIFGLLLSSCNQQIATVESTPLVEPHDFWQNTNLSYKGPVQTILGTGADVLVGTPDSTFFRSSDNGQTWTHQNLGIGFEEDMLCLARLSPTHLFAGTGGGGLYRSVDNGATWSRSQLPGPGTIVWNLSVSNTGEVLVAVFYGGVYQSSDSGSTWSHFLQGLDDRVQSVARTSSGRLLVGTNSGLFISSDNGSSWQHDTITIPTTYVHSIIQNSSDHVFITSGQTVYISTDFGVTWINSGLSAGTEVFSLAVGPNNEVVAGTLGNGIFISSDNGDEWIRDTTGLVNLNIRSIAMSSDGFIYGGTDSSGVFRSTNPISP